MNAEKFWYGWLKVAAILCTLFGILMALFNETILFEYFNRKISELFLLPGNIASTVAPLQSWLISVSGATMAGWGISILFLILYPLQRKELWSWNAIVLSLIVWFSLDTCISSYNGALFNVVINIIFLLQFFAPLLFLRTTMISTKETRANVVL